MADVPGYGQLERNEESLKTLINQLKFNSSNQGLIQSTNVGKGKILLGNDIEQLLSSASIRKESMIKQGLQFVRRRNNDGTRFYFIANRSDSKMEGWVTLQSKAKEVILFNPMTGQSGIGEFRKNINGNVEIYLKLNTDESIIVQTVNKSIKGNDYPYFNLKEDVQEITGNWTIQFNDGGPSLPNTFTSNELKPWTECEGDEFKTFSGTATYTIRFNRPLVKSNQYLLDLGKVYESAQVYINGKEIATLIGPDFICSIDDRVLKEDNILEIKVSNSMANRIIDLDKKNIVWKKFNNTNFPARLKENIGSDGLFNASKWEPRISGLKGPVTISAIKKNK